MGGFVLFDGEKVIYPLTAEEMVQFEHDNNIVFPDTTQFDINDKSKGDPIAKTLVVIQTGWFMLQCLARIVQHMPITELEVMTLAFATLNFATYALWWHKPLNVISPVRVLWRGANHIPQRWGRGQGGCRLWLYETVSLVIGWSDEAGQSKLSDSDRVPMFYWGPSDRNSIAFFGQIIAGTVFGAVHCIAWAFVFPSRVEMALWRVAALAVTVGPWLLAFGVKASEWSYDHGYYGFFWVGLGALFLTVYIVCRVVLLVLPLLLLRSLPPEIFQMVSWSTYTPHI